MNNLLLAAQALKIVAGLAQLGFSIWLFVSETRSPLNISFAAAFGLNGIAYALFNLAAPGQRSATSFAFQGRTVFNWLAAAAMLAFIVLVSTYVKRSGPLFLAAMVAVPVLVADLMSLRERNLSLSAFGGIATYPLTAFILGFLALAFSSADTKFRQFSAFVSAALAINSVDHLGAEIIFPSPTPRVAVFLQIAAMVGVLAFWLVYALRNSTLRREALLVLVCFIAPFTASLCVRLATGSYRGFQQSGIVGVGRLAAVLVLAYGTIAHHIFSIKTLPVTARSAV